jgi:hypothetical protein
MTDTQDHIGIRYASVVLARGIFNGVINVTLGAYNFDPDATNPKTVSREPVVVDRLRMDIPCAEQLYKALGEVLGISNPPVPEEPEPAEAKPGNEEGGLAAGAKLN